MPLREERRKWLLLVAVGLVWCDCQLAVPVALVCWRRRRGAGAAAVHLWWLLGLLRLLRAEEAEEQRGR